MGSTRDLGRRIELVPMDVHYSNITVALYEQTEPEYIVHSYSKLAGASGRLHTIVRVMQGLAALEVEQGRLRFPCRAKHRLGMRRTFLEACKVTPQETIASRPLSVLDKKLNRVVSARSLGDGLYELGAEGPVDESASRLQSIASGLQKLAEVDFVPGEPLVSISDVAGPMTR